MHRRTDLVMAVRSGRMPRRHHPHSQVGRTAGSHTTAGPLRGGAAPSLSPALSYVFQGGFHPAWMSVGPKNAASPLRYDRSSRLCFSALHAASSGCRRASEASPTPQQHAVGQAHGPTVPCYGPAGRETSPDTGTFALRLALTSMGYGASASVSVGPVLTPVCFSCCARVITWNG